MGGGGEKSDNGAKTVCVYLLTYIILYKNTAYFGGEKIIYSAVLFIIGWAIAPCPLGSTPLSTTITHRDKG